MATFPKIKNSIVTTGKVGLIFMEHILDPTGTTARNLDSFYHFEETKNYTQRMYFPMARRLLIMLAQLGYLHNDFHTGNILASGATVYIIDVGKATPITAEDYGLFSGYLQTWASSANPIELITFLHGKRIPIIAPEGKKENYLHSQWLRQNQIDTYVPGIDPSILIAPEQIVTRTLILSEDQKTRCVRAKIPYIEREATAREAAAREATAREAAAREAAAREATAREAAAQQKRKSETPEEKEARLAAEEAENARMTAVAREFGFV